MNSKKLKKYSTGMLFYGYLYPCSFDEQLFKKGYLEFPHAYQEDDTDLIVGVWSKENVEGDNDSHWSTAEVFLLVKVKYLKGKKSNDPDRPFLHNANVIGRLKKDNVHCLGNDKVELKTKLAIDFKVG